MQQKDYRELAKINRKIRLLLSPEEYKEHCIRQSDYFERRQKVIFGDDDFSFDRKQFLEWCGVKNETNKD